MNYDDQRKLALEMFGDLHRVKEVVENEDNCFGQIIDALRSHREEVLRRIADETIPSEWAYEWALRVGDRERMRDLVTESQYAYWWARDIGDHDVMRSRITESECAYEWAYYIGDREIMRNRITDSKWIRKWNTTFPNDRIEIMASIEEGR